LTQVSIKALAASNSATFYFPQSSMNAHASKIVLLLLSLPCASAFVPAPKQDEQASPSAFRLPVTQAYTAAQGMAYAPPQPALVTGPQDLYQAPQEKGWAFATETLQNAGARARAMEPELIHLKKQLIANKKLATQGDLEMVRISGPNCKTEKDFTNVIKKMDEIQLETHLIKAEAAAKQTYMTQNSVPDAAKAFQIETEAPELMARMNTVRLEVDSLFQDCGITV